MQNLRSVLLFATAILPPFTAAIGNYNNKMSFKELSKIYGRMGDTFITAENIVDKYIESKNYDKVKKIVVELRKEALTENSDWLILNREKPMDKPIK